MTTWTARAEALADTIREPGFHAAGVTASAWRAGVHAEATHGLVGAALALTAGDAMGSLWDLVPPCPHDTVLLEQAAGLEGAVTELAVHAGRLEAACRGALEAALARAAQAAAMMNAEDPRARAAAQAALAAARAEIAGCDAALEILGQVRGRLEYALRCLRQVPDDFASHYETPLRHKREQGPLPVSGDFLTAA